MASGFASLSLRTDSWDEARQTVWALAWVVTSCFFRNGWHDLFDFDRSLDGLEGRVQAIVAVIATVCICYGIALAAVRIRIDLSSAGTTARCSALRQRRVEIYLGFVVVAVVVTHHRCPGPLGASSRCLELRRAPTDRRCPGSTLGRREAPLCGATLDAGFLLQHLELLDDGASSWMEILVRYIRVSMIGTHTMKWDDIRYCSFQS